MSFEDHGPEECEVLCTHGPADDGRGGDVGVGRPRSVLRIAGTRVLVLMTSVYTKLPTPLRFLAATLRGYQLQARRYGPETEGLVEEALERETWDDAKWRQWVDGQLELVLHHALTRVPFYRDHWAERRRRGDRSSPEILQNWPILSKRTLSENPLAFVAESGRRRIFESHTSGTTGTPLRLWQSRDTLIVWYALLEARIRRWNGVTLQDRWAQMGGQLVTPVERRRPPFWVWNHGMHQLYMSSYHIAPASVGEYVEAMRRYQVRYLFGYPSAMHALACEILERHIEAPRLEVAISNAEPLLGLPAQRHRGGLSVPGSGHLRASRNRVWRQRVFAGVDAPLARGRRHGVGPRRGR